MFAQRNRHDFDYFIIEGIKREAVALYRRPKYHIPFWRSVSGSTLKRHVLRNRGVVNCSSCIVSIWLRDSFPFELCSLIELNVKNVGAEKIYQSTTSSNQKWMRFANTNMIDMKCIIESYKLTPQADRQVHRIDRHAAAGIYRPCPIFFCILSGIAAMSMWRIESIKIPLFHADFPVISFVPIPSFPIFLLAGVKHTILFFVFFSFFKFCWLRCVFRSYRILICFYCSRSF